MELTIRQSNTVFHIVFFQPCIPQNTGNAIRLAANTGAKLHLIEPLGFDMDAAKLKRAGLDYHDLAAVTVHPHWDAFCHTIQPKTVHAFSSHATTWYSSVEYHADDVLLFGPEPDGLPQYMREHTQVTHLLRIPMQPASRSLNLANSASVVLYEAWRQQGFPGGI